MDKDPFQVSGPLGRKKSVKTGVPKVRFDSSSSNNAPSFLTPDSHARGSMENKQPSSDVGNSLSEPPSKFRRLTASNIFGGTVNEKERTTRDAGGGRLSMWGEQIHEKLFAKKDIKEVMRTRLKFNLKDDSGDAPQIFHTDINDIIEYDEEDRQDVVKSNFASDFIESTAFRSFILITIVINSVFIALQTEKEMEKKFSYLFSAADQLILTIFICEILLKWYGGFFTYWKVGWNIFDFVIVASSLIGPSFTFISNSRVLRILRVLRAFRSLRSISALRPLQLVVQTIIQSLPDMANILLLLVIFMFVFAVIGVSLFAATSPGYFGNLETAMFTLFICITLDGWIEIFNTLRADQFPLASIYFVIFILIGAFILINLVVAVVVTNLESAIAEQDELDLQQMQEEKGNQEDSEELKTYDLRDVIDKKFWKHQKPIEVPNLPALNPQKVQNYMILVTAMEDNYTDMCFLKEELSKISKEVWEWNSPVDDDDDDEIDDPERPTTKATKILDEQEKSQKKRKESMVEKGEPRKSAFANLLSRASLMATENPETVNTSNRRQRQFSQSVEGPLPLNSVLEEDSVEEEDSDVEEDMEEVETTLGKGKEKARKKEGGFPSNSHLVPVEEEDKEDVDEEEEDPYKEDVDGVVPSLALMNDLYSGITKPKKSTQNFNSSKEERVAAIRERRESLIDHLENRDKKGDVLSDLITMNKKTNNFSVSGKSKNMSQFVHGVDWFRSKQKNTNEFPEKKKKWQVEQEQEREKVVYDPNDRTSVTSQSLLHHHLSYIALSNKDKIGTSEQDDVIKQVTDIRRKSLADIHRDISQQVSESNTDADVDGEEAADKQSQNSLPSIDGD